MAVNAKDFSAAFFHISSLKNANTRNNTAASKQPNLFWFWEKYHDFFHIIRTFYKFTLKVFIFWLWKVLESKTILQIVRNGHIYIQLIKQHMA